MSHMPECKPFLGVRHFFGGPCPRFQALYKMSLFSSPLPLFLFFLTQGNGAPLGGWEVETLRWPPDEAAFLAASRLRIRGARKRRGRIFRMHPRDDHGKSGASPNEGPTREGAEPAAAWRSATFPSQGITRENILLGGFARAALTRSRRAFAVMLFIIDPPWRWWEDRLCRAAQRRIRAASAAGSSASGTRWMGLSGVLHA